MAALKTYSKFYYGWNVTGNNQYLDFNDGSGVKTAKITPGYYSSASLAVEIKKKMDALSALDFTVSFNRTNRKFTISTTSNFSLLGATGPFAARSFMAVIGYNLVDKTGASSYLSDNSSAYSYSPQYILQSYKDTASNRKAIDGVVNKSASGQIEVIKFGNERFMSCEVMFVTDIIQNPDSIVRTNQNGLAEFTQFIEWCTEKAPVEFMADESNTSEYEEFILESTEENKDGLDFEIKEMYDKSLPYYYRSGILKFRLME